VKSGPAPVRHGAIRNYRLERAAVRSSFVTDDGQELNAIGSEVRTVEERYCAYCKTWERVEGVFGVLRWMAQHENGECQD